MDKSKLCKNCAVELIERKTKRTAEQLKKLYYYTAYYYCPNCKKMYLNDKFKVVNQSYDLFTDHHITDGKFDVEIWTDGACSNNGRENAKAAWAFVSGDYEENGLVEGKQTNNTAEALAIFHGLKWAAGKGIQKIKIYSDSQITLHNMQKNLDKITTNRDLFEKLFTLIKKHKLEVIYEKVLGHSGDINNERADKLANFLAGIE